MSYILDALVNAHAPAPRSARPARPTGRTPWKVLALAVLAAAAIAALVAVLIALVVAIGGGQMGWSGRSAALARPAAARLPATAPAPVMPPARESAASAVAAAVAAAMQPAPTPPALAASRPAARPAPAPAARFTPPVALSQPLPAPSPLGPGGRYAAAAQEADAAPPARVKPLSALPLDVRAAIAQLKVQVLFHAPQRRNRFVRIDDRELREGDDLSDVLRLEEITDTGLVIRHRDTLVLAPALAGG